MLLTGGINACGIDLILPPISTDADLVAAADRYCGQNAGALVDEVYAKVPPADVYVAGYWQILAVFSLRNVALQSTGFVQNARL